MIHLSEAEGPYQYRTFCSRCQGSIKISTSRGKPLVDEYTVTCTACDRQFETVREQIPDSDGTWKLVPIAAQTGWQCTGCQSMCKTNTSIGEPKKNYCLVCGGYDPHRVKWEKR